MQIGAGSSKHQCDSSGECGGPWLNRWTIKMRSPCSVICPLHVCVCVCVLVCTSVCLSCLCVCLSCICAGRKSVERKSPSVVLPPHPLNCGGRGYHGGGAGGSFKLLLAAPCHSGTPIDDVLTCKQCYWLLCHLAPVLGWPGCSQWFVFAMHTKQLWYVLDPSWLS